jgi:hypothetical protein
MAGYYLPYGNTSLTFDGSVNTQIFAQNIAESVVQTAAGVTNPAFIQVNHDGSAGTLLSDAATYKFDGNTDKSKILPWNFGITYAALFEPLGSSAFGSSVAINNLLGSGLVSQPTFKSTINPCLRRWHVGAGFELRYHFSDDADGWYAWISTAVQHVRSKINLNEEVLAEKQLLDHSLPNATGTAALPNIYGSTAVVPSTGIATNKFVEVAAAASTATPVGSVGTAYLNSGFPTDLAGDTGNSMPAPANVTEAFNQAAWNYGKIGCEQRITRLADIELSIGKLWNCGDCASTSWELGVVIPTGNKPSAEFVAPAVVGNDQHAGIRLGSTTSFMLSESDDSSTWYRLDMDGRYLFRNTQKRSFDLQGNEWSRYMMVWANKDAYTAAVTAANAPVVAGGAAGVANRAYTPGINVFTTDFYVKPQFQGRLTSAVVFCGERFKGELGWSTYVRQKECVELACSWDNLPAFADSSYVGGVGLNNSRTIYNDSQTTVANCVANLQRAEASTGLITLATTLLSDSIYDDFAITDTEISFDSVATPSAITQTPYVTLGYAFDYECKPVIALGGSYEFTTSNQALNQWLVWGKFEVAF